MCGIVGLHLRNPELVPQLGRLLTGMLCEMADRGEDFADYCWSFTKGKTLRGDGQTIVAQTDLSQAISKDLKRRGFKFVGPTIVYAWMQAVGIVNDHLATCFRRRKVGA